MTRVRAEDLAAALSAEELQTVNDAVDRGLEWLAAHQNPDGSFAGSWDDKEGAATYPVASTLLAFLSRGHQPGRGRYGSHINRAIDWLLSIQRPDDALSSRPLEKLPFLNEHALVGLSLSEAYGFTSSSRMERVSQAIDRALAYSRRMQQSPKLYPAYRGGWHYGDNVGPSRAHLSNVRTTCWELTFMRSANKAGFMVEQTWVDEGLEFVERCFKRGPLIVSDRRIPVAPDQAVFFYWPRKPPDQPIWANFDTTGAGMLALQLQGRREDPMIRVAADWLAAHTIPEQGTLPDVFHTWYSSSQAMAQVGGEHWKGYYPRLVRRLMPHQDQGGHWRLDRWVAWDQELKLGPAYWTASAVLCLTLPDQLLPIHQR